MSKRNNMIVVAGLSMVLCVGYQMRASEGSTNPKNTTVKSITKAVTGASEKVITTLAKAPTYILSKVVAKDSKYLTGYTKTKAAITAAAVAVAAYAIYKKYYAKDETTAQVGTSPFVKTAKK